MHTDRLARAIVWFTWAATLAWVAWAMAPLVSPVPLAEDWYSVGPLTGHEPHLGAWLWEQNNEHRMPLARLLLLGALKLAGGDYRVGGYLNLALLAALAAGLIVFVRQLRGRADVADAFFPLLFLHFGQSNQLLFPWQITFVLSIALVVATGCALFVPGLLVSRRAALVAGGVLLLLPLSGFIGLFFAGPLALYVFYAGARAWRTRRSPGLLMAATGACILAGAYFVGYVHPWWNPPSPGVVPSFKVMLKVLSLGFGPAPEFWWLPGVVGAVLLLASTLWRAWRDLSTRAGGALFLVTSILFAASVGWGRASYVPDFGIPIRYVLIVAPAFVASYLTWVVSPSRGRVGVPRALAFVMLVLLPVNTVAGHRFFSDWYRDGMSRVEADLAGPASIDEIARRHQPFLVHWWTPAELATRMRWLQTAGIPPFACRDKPAAAAALGAECDR